MKMEICITQYMDVMGEDTTWEISNSLSMSGCFGFAVCFLFDIVDKWAAFTEEKKRLKVKPHL